MKARLEAVGCSLTLVTFLRRPLDREVSALYYNKVNARKMLVNVSAAEYHNGEIRYILNNKLNEYGMEPFRFDNSFVSDDVWSQALAEATATLKRFDFVGTYENLSDGVAYIGGLIGEPNTIEKVPLQLVNNNSHPPLPDRLLEMVAKACTYDQKLYELYRAE